MSERERPSRFQEILHQRVPAGFNAALQELAAQQHTTRSEVVRQALLREVRNAGLELDVA